MFLPNELLSDISNFIPDDDVENLVFLSRAFVAVTAKRLPIINEKYKSPNKRHVDVNELLEDYAWRMFDLTRQKKNSNLKKFKDMKKEEAAFDINRNHLNLVHDDPIYRNVQQTEHITIGWSDERWFSWEMKRTSPSQFIIFRFQGYRFSDEAKLSLKIPHEIAEFTTGFEYETHFNGLANNCSVIRSIPQTLEEARANLVSEVVSYSGHYTLVSTLSGEVTVNITRAGVLIHRVTFNVATAFQHYLANPKPRLKSVATMDHGKVKLTSTGTCHFEFSLKQHVKQPATLVTTKNTGGSAWIGGAAPTSGGSATPHPLALSGVTDTAPSSEMNRMNLQGYNSRPRATYADVARDPSYIAATRYLPPIQPNPAGDFPFHQKMRTERDGNFRRKHPKKTERKLRWKY